MYSLVGSGFGNHNDDGDGDRGVDAVGEDFDDDEASYQELVSGDVIIRPNDNVLALPYSVASFLNKDLLRRVAYYFELPGNARPAECVPAIEAQGEELALYIDQREESLSPTKIAKKFICRKVSAAQAGASSGSKEVSLLTDDHPMLLGFLEFGKQIRDGATSNTVVKRVQRLRLPFTCEQQFFSESEIPAIVFGHDSSDTGSKFIIVQLIEVRTNYQAPVMPSAFVVK